jgi:transcriptional regulator of acetoin/glycerol metabolism
MALLLTDERGQVLVRRPGNRVVEDLLDSIQLAPGFLYSEESVGTNAIGTAITQRTEAVVHGPDHFAEALIEVACSAMTVRDPNSGRVLGTVDLTCDAERWPNVLHGRSSSGSSGTLRWTSTFCASGS